MRATITSSREGPRESDLPAAAAAACSSLLSAPITGASVPTKTNSVVQPSEQPLPLPELLPSSPAARKSHQIKCTLKYQISSSYSSAPHVNGEAGLQNQGPITVKWQTHLSSLYWWCSNLGTLLILIIFLSSKVRSH